MNILSCSLVLCIFGNNELLFLIWNVREKLNSFMKLHSIINIIMSDTSRV